MLCRRQNLDDAQPNTSMGTRLYTLTNSIRKIFTLQPQWLDPINVRNNDLTMAIRDNRISMNICPFAINLQHFSRIRVIINSHASITNNGNTPNFARMEPTDMNVCRRSICKTQIKMGDVICVCFKMSMCLRPDPLRLLAQQVEQYRDIMRSKVPDNVGIAAV